LALSVAMLTRSGDVRSARDVGVVAAAVARSAPLLAPLALVVLVLPALTADPWRVAAQPDVYDVAVLLLLTVVPLYALVARQLIVHPRSPNGCRAQLTAATLFAPHAQRDAHRLVERRCSSVAEARRVQAAPLLLPQNEARRRLAADDPFV
jgi:hypothetical protein